MTFLRYIYELNKPAFDDVINNITNSSAIGITSGTNTFTKNSTTSNHTGHTAYTIIIAIKAKNAIISIAPLYTYYFNK